MKKSIGWIAAVFACFSLVSAFANEELVEQEQVNQVEVAAVVQEAEAVSTEAEAVSTEVAAVEATCEVVEPSEVAATELPAVTMAE